jgi:diguanylate cyclase (GGDEF)-like protein
VVRAVRSELRNTDIFARLGGDEFAVVFPDAEPDEASVIIDRIHRRLETNPLQYEGHTRHLDFSASVVAVRSGESSADLLRRADRLMYEAKSRGKGLCLARA